jgi:hypothetical protein
VAFSLTSQDVNFFGDLGVRTQIAMAASDCIARLAGLDTLEHDEPTADDPDAIEAELLFEAARLAAELGDLPRARASLRAATKLFDRAVRPDS